MKKLSKDVGEEHKLKENLRTSNMKGKTSDEKRKTEDERR